ncbi:Rv3654c family TadE-like protein [Allobranchiibius huperziae]|uniref:Secretion/DNA translocation related TadE-like protein n=1 Tax=Allobranchiibius huperziae TaxID=1874116 RepID=A0A853DER8_9MICO|nr:secretion/DNA translocation related TadE-like protein [Allobranchiibius huperziae]
MRWARDRGSGTVLMVGVIAVVLCVLGGGLALVSAVQASMRARTAADMAALAGESALLKGGVDPCAAAARVASAGGATLRTCTPTGDSVTVDVTVVTGATARLGLGAATARSRAGYSAGIPRSTAAVPWL